MTPHTFLIALRTSGKVYIKKVCKKLVSVWVEPWLCEPSSKSCLVCSGLQPNLHIIQSETG